MHQRIDRDREDQGQIRRLSETYFCTNLLSLPIQTPEQKTTLQIKGLHEMKKIFAILLSASLLCSAAATTAQAKKKAKPDYDVYLLIGQSNMAGRGTLLDKDYKEKFKGIYLLDEEGVAVPASHPFNQYSSIRKGMSIQQMNPGYGFSKQMRKYNKKRPILLVCNPRGGTSILEWAPGQHYYTEAVRRARQGMRYGKLKGILWHQGCADSRNRVGVYMGLLKELVDKDPDYARKNFQWGILQTCPLRITDREIVHLEQTWKKKFGEKACALNAN